jgi:hypothetical protein
MFPIIASDTLEEVTRCKLLSRKSSQIETQQNKYRVDKILEDSTLATSDL